MTPRNHAGFTKVELLVVLVVAIVLLFLVINPCTMFTSAHIRNRMPQALSNMKQLHLATQQMALDGVTTEDTNWGWPGDTGGTFTNWTAQLLKGGYLTDSELRKLLSAPGVIVKPGTTLTATNTALLAYAVRRDSASNAVFLSTANFTNAPSGGVFNPRAKPYGQKGFVIFRRAGDGSILQPRVTDTNIVGSYVPLCR